MNTHPSPRRRAATVAGLLPWVLALAVAPPAPGAAETLRPGVGRPAVPPPAGGEIEIVAEGAGLRVALRDARPREVLEALGTWGAVPVIVRGALPGRLTRAFTAADLEAAVREVLRGYAAALVFTRGASGATGRLRHIEVLATGQASPASPESPPESPPASPAAVEPPPRRDPQGVRAAPGSAGPGTAGAELARALAESLDAIVRLQATERDGGTPPRSAPDPDPHEAADAWGHPGIADAVERLIRSAR